MYSVSSPKNERVSEPFTWLDHVVMSYLNNTSVNNSKIGVFLKVLTDDFFRTIFHLFEAGIANAISSSKWRKLSIIYEQKYIFKM